MTAPTGRSNTARALWVAGFLIWMVALFAVSPYDLWISQTVADTESLFGRFIYLFGTTPSGIMYVSSLAVLMVPALRRRTDWLQVAAITVLAMALLHPLGITTLIKLLWGRIRFVHLAGDFSLYTPFYLPNELAADVSFPSGHTASACVLSPVVFLLLREGRKKAAGFLAAFVVVWGSTVAWGRVVYGAHYVTDVVFSIGFSFLFAPFVATLGRYLRDRYYPAGGPPPRNEPRAPIAASQAPRS